MLNSDFYYCIGSSHHFCEDFAISQKTENNAFAILSDGCSSVKQSMIGSMLLTKSAEFHIYPNKNSQEMVDLTIQTANIYRRAMNVDSESLSATLLTVSTIENAFKATATGDGVIVAKHKEKGLEYIDIEYSSGAPFYPKYKLSKDDLDLYLEKFPGDYKLNISDNETIIHPLEFGCKTIEYIFSFDEYEFVGIMSDGAKSFYHEDSNLSKTKTMIPLKDIVNEMFNFKRYHGDFVKSRTQKAFNLFQKQNFKHFDDFSMGVVVKYE